MGGHLLAGRDGVFVFLHRESDVLLLPLAMAEPP
jgi:hypothetical protein